jgi:hypothetical protein
MFVLHKSVYYKKTKDYDQITELLMKILNTNSRLRSLLFKFIDIHQ